MPGIHELLHQPIPLPPDSIPWVNPEKTRKMIREAVYIFLSGRVSTEEAKQWRRNMRRIRPSCNFHESVQAPPAKEDLVWTTGKSFAAVLASDCVIAHHELGMISAAEVALALTLDIPVRTTMPSPKETYSTISPKRLESIEAILPITIAQLIDSQSEAIKRLGLTMPNQQIVSPETLKMCTDLTINEIIITYLKHVDFKKDGYIVFERLRYLTELFDQQN